MEAAFPCGLEGASDPGGRGQTARGADALRLQGCQSTASLASRGIQDLVSSVRHPNPDQIRELEREAATCSSSGCALRVRSGLGPAGSGVLTAVTHGLALRGHSCEREVFSTVRRPQREKVTYADLGGVVEGQCHHCARVLGAGRPLH